MTTLRVRRLTLVISTQRIPISVTQLQKVDQERQKMKMLPLYALVIALGLVPMSMLSGYRHHNSPTANGNVAQITAGAFRDGLYLGRLAAEGGSEPHVAIGRWATAEDRSSFTAGYHRGYSELLASRAELDNRVRQTK
jgi:hypothetical protein